MVLMGIPWYEHTTFQDSNAPFNLLGSNPSSMTSKMYKWHNISLIEGPIPFFVYETNELEYSKG